MATAAMQMLNLPSVIDLDVMDDVKDWLVEATSHGPVQLKGSEVERCATNALLMLATAARTAEINGYTLHIKQPSAALNDAVARLGMSDIYSSMIEDE